MVEAAVESQQKPNTNAEEALKLTPLQEQIAQLLAQGYQGVQVAELLGCDETHVSKLKNDHVVKGFAKYLDKLTLEAREAHEAEMLRVIRKMVRQKEGRSKRDVLDWIEEARKFLRGDGIGVNVTNVLNPITIETDAPLPTPKREHV